MFLDKVGKKKEWFSGWFLISFKNGRIIYNSESTYTVVFF